MKGTRTYQLVGILVLFAVLSLLKVFEQSLGFSIEDIKMLGEYGEQVLVALLKMYVAFLAIWKVIKPHPMRFEKKE